MSKQRAADAFPPTAPLLALGFALLALLCVLFHARMRVALRNAEQPALLRVLRVLPASNLALAGNARHLRFPSLEEPAAAFADAPASFDLNPSGGAMAPPREVYAAEAQERATRALAPKNARVP